MGRKWTLAFLAVGLVFSAAAHAQPGVQTAPGVQVPAGIESRGTILPGQRQPAAIFGAPSTTPPRTPSSQSQPAQLAPSTTTTPATPPATNEEIPESKPTTPEPYVGPNPFDAYSKQLQTAKPQPERVLAPALMDTPAHFPPAGPPVTPGFNLGNLPSPRSRNENLFPAGVPMMPGLCGRGSCQGCGSCGGCNGGCGQGALADPYWFGLVGGLYMGRTSPNQMWVSQQRSDPSNRLMSGADASVPWTAGWEASFGRVSPGYGGVQFTYWGLAPSSGYNSVRLPGDLGTPINFCNFDIGGICAGDFFDMAEEHRVWRRDEVNNVELNFFSGSHNTPVGPCQFSWLAGVRYFRFRDQLIFGAVQEGFEFGDNGGVNEAYVNVATANNLIGAQIGGWGSCPLGSRMGIFLFPRVGLYANQANQNYQIYRGDGLSVFNYNSNKTTGALLAQIDVGITYNITPLWSAYLGYRVVAVSGIGLADNQLPATMITSPNVADINSNGDLILQGGTAGMLWRF